MSSLKRVQALAAWITALGVIGVALVWVLNRSDDVQAVMNTPELQRTVNGQGVEISDHHDSLAMLFAKDSLIEKKIEIDLHNIKDAIVDLKEAQEEYQDSALVERARRACSQNPESCR